MNVSEQIAEQLARRIIGGEWEPGESLPSLRRLAEQFGVSLVPVREAVQTLKARGLLESRQGSGTFVLGPVEQDPVVPWMPLAREAQEYHELNEARKLIEGLLIELAVERRTPDDLRRMHNAIQTMVDARSDVASFLEADLEFHITVAEAAHNRVLLRAMLAMRGPLKRLMAARALSELREVGSFDNSIKEHETIVESIRSREVSDAIGALNHIVARGEAHLDILDESED